MQLDPILVVVGRLREENNAVAVGCQLVGQLLATLIRTTLWTPLRSSNWDLCDSVKEPLSFFVYLPFRPIRALPNGEWSLFALRRSQRAPIMNRIEHTYAATMIWKVVRDKSVLPVCLSSDWYYWVRVSSRGWVRRWCQWWSHGL